MRLHVEAITLLRGALVALSILGGACTSTESQLIDPSDPGTRYVLADVDGQRLPVQLGITYTFAHGEERALVSEAELLLRADSTALLATRLQIRAPQWDTTCVMTAGYRYTLTGDSLNWCPDLPPGSPGPCYAAAYSRTQVTLRALFYGPPGGGRYYRFVR